MHLLFEPRPESFEVACCDGLVQPWQLSLRRIEDLDCCHGSKRIGGEVASQTCRPVYILKAALAVVCRFHPQVLLHLLIPEPWNFVHIEGSFYQALLNFEAKNDVQRIRHFIRFHPDQVLGLDYIQSSIEVLRTLFIGESSGEGFPQLRQEVARKRQAERDHAFPKQRLTLVNRHASRLTHGQAVVLLIAALLVERMACLMDCTSDALCDILFLESGCHAHVRRARPSREWVNAHIQAALLQVKTQSNRDISAETCLLLSVKVTLQPGIIRCSALLTKLSKKRNQPSLDLIEDLLDSSCREACGVVVGQDIVGGLRGIDHCRPLLPSSHPLAQHR
mmetsp:Transcript_2018/g.3116  ORF Transcript_2018/g.3116 Transcript_2018/m.3116 type:complete len:335 (-) Transcript_2018:681-1685(-)